MTPFRQWKEGESFEFMDGSATRYGVKLAQIEYYEAGERKKANAFFFDTNALEFVSHNKNVERPRIVQGRLARTHDNRPVIVQEARKGLYAGYYVNLTGYTNLAKSDFDLIHVEAGERREEVDIILQNLRRFRNKEQKLFETLEILLTE